jgi:hypothetical protein
MNDTFRFTQLAGDRALIQGADGTNTPRQAIVSSKQFTELKANENYEKATGAFDARVEAFFAPLTAAADALKEASKVVRDPAFFIVVDEAVKGSAEKREHIIDLKRDTVILRMIEAGDTSRLIWVGDDIEILAYDSTPTAVASPTPVAVPAPVLND